MDPQVQIRILDLANEITGKALPRDITRGENGLKEYLSYFDTAYQLIVATVTKSNVKQ